MKCFVIFFASEIVRASTVEGGPARRRTLRLRRGILSHICRTRQGFSTRRPSVLSSLEITKGYQKKDMSLKERIAKDLPPAMKSKEAAGLSTLRMVKAALQNREIEKGEPLTDEELTKLFQSLVKQRRDSVEQYEKAARAELADKERAEIAVIEESLRKAASREEIERAVTEAIAETGASSMKEMGAVMKAAQAKLGGS